MSDKAVWRINRGELKNIYCTKKTDKYTRYFTSELVHTNICHIWILHRFAMVTNDKIPVAAHPEVGNTITMLYMHTFGSDL